MELIDESSQGSEDTIDEMLVYILIKLRHYDEALDLLKKITKPIYLNHLRPELKLFRIK